MRRALEYAKNQYQSVRKYVQKLGLRKPIHLGETGWASACNGFYGPQGSKATDEYKQSIYYHAMRRWSEEAGISCFFFEAFDEIWKDAPNPGGSENHFGLFTVDGQAKHVLWKLVDQGKFKGLQRGGKAIRKTYEGGLNDLLKETQVPAYFKGHKSRKACAHEHAFPHTTK